MKILLFFLLFFSVSGMIKAQSCGFTLQKIQLSSNTFSPFIHTFPLILKEKVPAPASILLPRWSAENLPFFCKIEHDWAKQSKLPLKFRLGSVEYVDQLEGKRR